VHIESGLVGDVAMVSIRFRSNTAQVIRTLRTAGWPRVIALMPPTADVAQVMEVIAAGASGVVSTPGVALVAPDDALPVHSLTPREIEILRRIAGGATNKQVAEQVCTSEKTVGRHLANIYAKLGVSSRTAAVAWAHANNLL
jgi:DNA-binding NarL/FixJ family response regulator